MYVAGGEPCEEYKSIIQNLNLRNIYFTGFLSSENLNNLYRAADLFVLPTRYDIWGLVINEAMAKGLPVITTDKCVAGLELIEDSENGFIVPVEDETTLADKMNLVLCDDKLQKYMSKNNLYKIRNYSIENMAKVCFDVFKKFHQQNSN